MRHDEATQPFPQPSDFKGGPVDNLELKSCEIESLCRKRTKPEARALSRNAANRQDSQLDRNMPRSPPPRTSEIGPTPRPVKSVIRHIVCVWPIMAVVGACDAMRASRRRAVRAKGINCYGDIGHEETALWPNTRYVPAVMVRDDGPSGNRCLCRVGAGQQQRNCRCHQPNQKYQKHTHDAFLITLA